MTVANRPMPGPLGSSVNPSTLPTSINPCESGLRSRNSSDCYGIDFVGELGWPPRAPLAPPSPTLFFERVFSIDCPPGHSAGRAPVSTRGAALQGPFELLGSGGPHLQAQPARTTAPGLVDNIGRAAGLLSDVQVLEARGQRADALDLIFDRVETLLLHGNLDEVRWILRAAAARADDALLPLSAFLCLLTATRPWATPLRREREMLAAPLRRRAAAEQDPNEGLGLLDKLL